MMHADAAHAKDVPLACVVVCDSVGFIIAQSAYIKFNVLPKFISSMLCSVACRKLLPLIVKHSI